MQSARARILPLNSVPAVAGPCAWLAYGNYGAAAHSRATRFTRVEKYVESLDVFRRSLWIDFCRARGRYNTAALDKIRWHECQWAGRPGCSSGMPGGRSSADMAVRRVCRGPMIGVTWWVMVQRIVGIPFWLGAIGPRHVDGWQAGAYIVYILWTDGRVSERRVRLSARTRGEWVSACVTVVGMRWVCRGHASRGGWVRRGWV